MSAPVLEISNLSVRLPNDLKVLNTVDLRVEPGEVRALVGESGAGKSMLGKAVLGILPAGLRQTGRITVLGQALDQLPASVRRREVARHVSLIPQDPLTALNPVRPIAAQMTDAMVRIHGWPRRKALARAADLLEQVHIRDVARVLKSYPHELSGGMRQRVLIAAAFATEPKLIVADEPTTALDATVQREILRIIRGLQQETGTTVLFVTHDMGVVAQISQRVTVLFGGRVVEHIDTEALFAGAGQGHAYSRALIRATPDWTRSDAPFAPVPPEVIADLMQEQTR
ncbi:ABC transporter ATP-binding protein [Phaeobacter sp. HF9A]|uniref:ABC transporter ATP-binding protein n=1 Tax=Phaeobacter sp. HF9A TaxID=2721561 RepID=UPI001431F9F2|nr:ABC transporter ATP-binding protein [Phaeobacter sp. HF9A]NIZ11975.1 ABC transporter ATP-binding protein [Phaeobacter sp. HF9A]